MCGSESITSMGVALFDTVPPDLMGFGLGSSFNAKSVQSFLSLKKEDVSHIAYVSPKSVRFDDAMPVPVRERLQEIANTINLVARFFGGGCGQDRHLVQDPKPFVGRHFTQRHDLSGAVSASAQVHMACHERQGVVALDSQAQGFFAQHGAKLTESTTCKDDLQVRQVFGVIKSHCAIK